jgi:tetratricopeptide (TPR) repeat protein
MARITVALLAAVAAATLAMAQSKSESKSKSPRPRGDERLPVSTLVREDIFAGFMDDDMERFARGEETIERLLKERPAEKPVLLAWKGGATLYRAVLAWEKDRPGEFRETYARALDLFAEAKKLGPDDFGVDAATGGSFVVFADRLPEERRAAAWSEAYDRYRLLWKQQSAVVGQLPRHLRGELLAGLARSAQRTGRAREAEEYLDKILKLLPDTPYEPVARRWKDDPKAAVGDRITCLTCHTPGRLAARRAALDKD